MMAYREVGDDVEITQIALLLTLSGKLLSV
jgi:hypothetical protein